MVQMLISGVKVFVLMTKNDDCVAVCVCVCLTLQVKGAERSDGVGAPAGV